MAKRKGILRIRLDAGNDFNGNPRRVFVIFDREGNIIDSVDEGYRGDAGVRRLHPSARDGGTFPTTARTYRDLIKAGSPS